MINEAIKYRIEHNLSVFPIRSELKRPVFEWERFQKGLANLQEIRSWSDNWNLGMVCGAISGVVIVDCESPEDARWFLQNRVTTPLLTQTPRGYHLWFRHPGTYVKNAQKVKDEFGQVRYDIRGDGGYVLLPPSHVTANGSDVKVTGNYRFWQCSLQELARIPTFRLAWGASAEPPDDRRVKDGPAYIKHIRAVSGQGGHNETYRAVCRLKDAGLDSFDAFCVLQDWNQTNANPPWSEKELKHKIRSVYGGGE